MGPESSFLIHNIADVKAIANTKTGSWVHTLQPGQCSCFHCSAIPQWSIINLDRQIHSCTCCMLMGLWSDSNC